MAVTYNPFVSKSGFKSEGFEVNPLGDLTARDIVAQDIFAGNIDATTIKLNGQPIFGSGDSTGTFQIESDFIVSAGSTPYLSVIDGQVVINSNLDSVGQIDNVDIGSTTPGSGTFTNIRTGALGTPVLDSNTNLVLSAANAVVFRVNGVNKGKVNEFGSNVPVVDTVINNTVIGSITPSTGTFTTVNINNQPSLPSSATRKDYVDTKISAFAIAFGI